MRFNVCRVPNAGPQAIAHERQCQTRQQPQYSSSCHHNGALGLNRVYRHSRHIHHANITDLALFDQPQLLGTVEQLHVKFSIDFQITHEAQQVLLDIWEGFDLTRQRGKFPGKASNLGVNCLNNRVLGGKTRFQLFALLLQFN